MTDAALPLQSQADQRAIAAIRRKNAIWRRILRDPPAAAAALFLLVVVLAAILAPLVAPFDPYANNMRLFEATGMGALLITDLKDNIADLFEPGKEVVCYKSVDECIELIDYYSRHEAERAAIAAAGQRRTLQSHSYAQVVADQVRIFERYLAAKAA